MIITGSAPEGYPRILLIDDREPILYAEILSQHVSIPIEIKRMKTGDFYCDPVIVERKTIFDFAGSIVDGRIFSQFERLRKYPKPFIVITGCKRELLEKSEINYNSILACEAWLASNGVTVIREESIEDSAYLIGKIFEKHGLLQWITPVEPKVKTARNKKKGKQSGVNTASGENAKSGTETFNNGQV